MEAGHGLAREGGRIVLQEGSEEQDTQRRLAEAGSHAASSSRPCLLDARRRSSPKRKERPGPRRTPAARNGSRGGGYFTRSAFQSRERSPVSALPVMASPLSLPLYFVVNFWPFRSRVTENFTSPSL